MRMEFSRQGSLLNMYPLQTLTHIHNYIFFLNKTPQTRLGAYVLYGYKFWVLEKNDSKVRIYLYLFSMVSSSFQFEETNYSKDIENLSSGALHEPLYCRVKYSLWSVVQYYTVLLLTGCAMSQWIAIWNVSCIV